MRKAAPSPGRPEEMTNAQPDAENAGQIIPRRGGCMVAAAGKKWRGGRAGKKKLITIEAGICMKTNKTTTICPAKKRHFCKTKRHFMQRHTSFAEIGGFLVTFRALRNAFFASKRTNSSAATRRGESATADESAVENAGASYRTPKLASVCPDKRFERGGLAKSPRVISISKHSDLGVQSCALRRRPVRVHFNRVGHPTP